MVTLGQMPNEQQTKAEIGSTATACEARAGRRRHCRPAAQQGLRTGDVILDVGGKAVANAGNVCKAMAGAQAQGKHDLLMR